MTDRLLLTNLDKEISSLVSRCRRDDWKGYDPYDALNSKLFRATPFFRNKLCRIAFTQALKRTPVNVRPLLGIPKERNPKALALFATALLKLPDGTIDPREVLKLLIGSKTEGFPYACWGYNFAWQNRVTFVPKREPNIICTTFAGQALLDAYERYGDAPYLDAALSASDFLRNGLHILQRTDEVCFSYTPRDHEQVHNANLLGAAFLARLYQHTGKEELLDLAIASARFTVNRQAADGSWPYGESPTQQWIDNFHTGYNLVALKRLVDVTRREDFRESMRKGFEYYIDTFFEDNGIAKYYHDRTYPIDIHAVAQSIITLAEFREQRAESLDLAVKVYRWAQDHMRAANGFYYFQQSRWITNRNLFMRWSQAWMLLALVTLSEAIHCELDGKTKRTEPHMASC